jgi:hypothetical protein
MGAVAPVPYLQMRTDAIRHPLNQERDKIPSNLNANSPSFLKRDEVDFWQTR